MFLGRDTEATLGVMAKHCGPACQQNVTALAVVAKAFEQNGEQSDMMLILECLEDRPGYSL